MLARKVYATKPMNMQTCVWIIASLVVATPLRADDLLEGLSDPTRPPSHGAVATGVTSRGGLVLQSTLVSPERQVAVISGQSLTVGGKIGDAKVIAIRPFEVVLSRSGKESALRMLPKSDVEKRIVEAAPNADNP
jgi:MSHA biogenesis protein MshK